MRQYPNAIMALLRAYHGFPNAPAPSCTDDQARLMYDRGLGCVAAAALNPDALQPETRERLLSVELTARVIHQQIAETVVDILGIAAQQEIMVGLIKGIAVAESFYPAPHHRIMGDIDILVSTEQASILQNALRDNGYEYAGKRSEPRTPKNHHHLPPLKHPDTGIVIEIHSGLFSHPLMSDEPLFDQATLWSHNRPGQYHGAPCHRFTPEFEFLYTVAHWAVDQKWDINVVSINDVIFMLNDESRSLDWSLIDGWLADNPRTAEFLSVLLLFLRDAGLARIPSGIEARVAASANRIGSRSVALMHWLMLRFPLADSVDPVPGLNGRDARTLWQALFVPRHRLVRLPAGVLQLLAHKVRSTLGTATRGIRRSLRQQH